jgi:hypothetical protein
MLLLSWLFPLLAFVPGIPVIFLIFRKLNYKPDVLELILAGFILWNYVLVAPALLIGLSSNAVVQYFSIFTLISIGICAISLVWVFVFVIKNNYVKLPISIQYSNLLVLLIVVCLSFFMLLAAMFHYQYLNWDPIGLYLPFSKSIALTGGLQYEIFHLSEILTAQSPLLPLTYAWVLSGVGQAGLSTLPFIYFSMILVAIFLVTKEIMPKNLAPISLLAFLVMPAVLSTMSYHSLYLEIAFTCYFMTTLFMAIKATKGANVFHYFLLSASMFLFALSRFEFAAFVAPSFLAVLFYFKFNIRFKRIISTILFSSVFWVRFLFNVLFSELSLEWKYFLLCSIFPLLTDFSVIVYLLLGRIDEPRLNLNDKFKSIKKGIVLFFPLFPAAVYLARNVIRLECINTFFLWNSSYQDTTSFYSNFGVQPSVPLVLDVFRWDKLFLSDALIALFFIPFFIGVFYTIYCVVKRKVNKQYVFFMLVFLTYFVFWSRSVSCDVQVRRLFVFAPFAAIIVAYGTSKLASFFNSTQRLISRFAVYSVLMFSLIWMFKIKAATFDDFVYSYTLFGVVNPFELIMFSILFIAVVLSFDANSTKIVHMKSKLPRLSLPKTKILDFVRLFLCMLLIFAVLFAPASDILAENNEMRFSYHPRVKDVIDYYNTYINDSYTTVAFYTHELIWYANRSIIDLSSPLYSVPLISVLNEENSTIIKNSLLDADIRYFLVPKQNDNHYDLYQQFSNDLVLFEMMRDDPYFEYVAEFRYYELFKLLSEDEVNDKYLFLSTLDNDPCMMPINNWSEIVQSDHGVLVVGEGGGKQPEIVSETQASFWRIGGEFVELSNATVDGRDCVKIDMLPHPQSNIFLAHNYETPQDWSSEAYLSFYLYGAHTNASIPMVFHTTAWADCFVYSIVDDFSGWKYFSIPKSKIAVSKGTPSWDNITRIDMMLGNIYGSNEATFYLGDVNFIGYHAGITYDIPEISGITEDTNLLVSLRLLNSTFLGDVELRSGNDTLLYKDSLDNETDLIKINSEYLLDENNKLVIYIITITEGDLMEIRFIAVTK